MKGEEEIVEELKDPSKPMEALTASEICRKEKRKLVKKMKRKQIRKDVALKQRQEEESRLDDQEEHRKLMLKEQEEAEMVERQRKEFEERERLWIERAAKLAQEEEEEEARRKLIEEEEEKAHKKQCENENDLNEDDGWEYVEEGPAEIIWQGNEIIVKKKRVRVAKRNSDHQPGIIEDADRPTSNPLPPQSEAFFSYKNTSISAKQVFESVSSQTPNFGTEQDKANCPFHIKTGACRFGSRCSRIHFYPDKSCTLLIKNMYSGPGLAWEQDEGLEHTDEEVERCYEEFYEDVHTEFLKFGEIVNFKVCRNGSFHLRGNVYVHYRSLESAMLAYHSVNGRYFAGKQITCEYVGVTRWKVAICGEYMKSRFKTCSRGTACNFIHCFRNPGGDYEWADSDKPPPKYWIKKMDALFGPSDELEHDKHQGSENRSQQRYSSKKATPKSDRYHSGRSRSTDMDYSNSSVDEDNSDENRSQLSSSLSRHKYLASARYMRSSGGDHYSRDYYVGDRERHSRLSRVRSRYSSKWEDHPNDCENGEKKYSNNDYECNEGKDRLQSDDSFRKHHQSQNRNHSVRRDHKTRMSKVADLDEHARSDEYYESDNPSWCDGKYNSHDSNSRPSSETVDPCDRWERRASSPYSHYSSDDHKPFEVKTRDQSSSGHHNKVRSTGSGRSSRKLHSKNWEEEGGSSSEGQHSEENHEYYRVKRHHRKHGSHGHNERRTQKNESSTSRESREKSNSEKEACPPGLYDDSGHHQEIHRSGRRSRKYQGNKRGKHHTEKDASTEEDEKLKVKRTSRKRSRSRSPIQCSSRSRKASVPSKGHLMLLVQL